MKEYYSTNTSSQYYDWQTVLSTNFAPPSDWTTTTTYSTNNIVEEQPPEISWNFIYEFFPRWKLEFIDADGDN